ncbi:hypothetical protein [Neobacillus cucumis]|uniref:hypothetical protein n=1 Tax=Neobacillus cucumis TaxID=1740721 RepID=UPI002E23F5B9|nr:hypothetical protein [Neobacillus cucumis]
MDTNKKQQIEKTNTGEQGFQDKTENTQINNHTSAQEDGFRYDFNDSSEFK